MAQRNQIRGPRTTGAVVLASTAGQGRAGQGRAGHGKGHLDANARDIDPFF